jgi:hypothetical protein
MSVKLLITYNIKPAQEEEYYRFMMDEFLPTAQSIGLVMVEGWSTAWGDYPDRLIGLVAENQHTIQEILDGEGWLQLENRLASFVKDYQREPVLYRNGFQFLKPT